MLDLINRDYEEHHNLVQVKRMKMEIVSRYSKRVMRVSTKTMKEMKRKKNYKMKRNGTRKRSKINNSNILNNSSKTKKIYQWKESNSKQTLRRNKCQFIWEFRYGPYLIQIPYRTSLNILQLDIVLHSNYSLPRLKHIFFTYHTQFSTLQQHFLTFQPHFFKPKVQGIF